MAKIKVLMPIVAGVSGKHASEDVLDKSIQTCFAGNRRTCSTILIRKEEWVGQIPCCILLITAPNPASIIAKRPIAL